MGAMKACLRSGSIANGAKCGAIGWVERKAGGLATWRGWGAELCKKVYLSKTRVQIVK